MSDEVVWIGRTDRREDQTVMGTNTAAFFKFNSRPERRAARPEERLAPFVAEAARIAEVVGEAVGSRGKLEWVRASDIGADPHYQRPLKAQRVRKIIKTFDPDLFGVLMVSRRGDGSLWVMDGQHRLRAMTDSGRGAETVPCMVYEGLSIEDEAKIFYRPQMTRVGLSAGERFRAKLEERDPDALDLKALVEAAGFLIDMDNNRHGGRICAVSMLERLHQQYPESTLPAVLRMVRSAWGGDTTGVTSGIIFGLGVFHTRYSGLYNEGTLVAALRRVSSPVSIEGDAKALGRLTGRHNEDMVGMTLLRLYNHGKSSRRLPEWDDAPGGRPSVRVANRTVKDAADQAA